MRFLSVLPVAALFVLWAGTKTGLCLTPCPSHCSAARVVVVKDNVVTTEEGPRAKIVAEITLALQKAKPDVKKTKIKIGLKWVEVPVTLKKQVQDAVKKFPELGDLVLSIVVSKVKPPRPKRTPKPKPPPVVPYTPPKSEAALEDLNRPVVVPPTPETVKPEVRAAIELLLNFPNHMPTIFVYLVNIGVKFQDTTKPITGVTVGGTFVPFPKPLKLGYTINVNGKGFNLPRDSKQLAVYVQKHPHLLTVTVTLLHQLGAQFTVDGGGKISSFVIFGKTQPFPKSMGGSVFVGGRSYNLPKDIKVLLKAVRSNPAQFFKIEFLLLAYGVRITKSSGGSTLSATYGGGSYDISVKKPVRITVGQKSYDIPADLEAIFKSQEGLQVGAVLQALQLAKVPLKVDKNTGIVTGIVVSGVTVPFPVTVDLRFKLYGKQYVIPRDLGKIVAVLEKKNMPSLVLSILYSRYGVVPVRNADKVVVALSFDKMKFPVKARPLTALVIAGVKLLLPRDVDKMYDLVSSNKVKPMQLLQALQLVGYTFIPGPDGKLSTLQKGAERIELNFAISLHVKYGEKTYWIPNDLPLLVDVISKLPAQQLASVMGSLNKQGAVMAMKGAKVVIFFNGIKYKTNLKSSPGAKVGLVVYMGNNTFSIPKDLKAIVSFANGKGAAVIQLLVELFKALGVKVNQSPKGLILSIVIDGKTYRVSGGGGNGGAPGGQVRVTIRGRKFWIPKEMGRLPDLFTKFHYAELVVALIRMGATLLSDKASNFYGFRYKGRVYRFLKTFVVAVRVDRTEVQYRIPGDLKKLAKTLSKGRWVWHDVRRTLKAAGVKVSGGSGEIRSFSFQGKTYQVRR